MLPKTGAVKSSNTDPIVKIILYQRSETPLSITSHCEKYKKKVIKTIEFAKSYKVQSKMFFLFITCLGKSFCI